MLRRISLAIAGTLLVSGVVVAAPHFAAQATPTFPVSVNETGPSQSTLTTESAPACPGAMTGGMGAASMSEMMQQMMGGQAHPAMTR